MDDEEITGYIAGPPDASGTFAGTYDPGVLDAYLPEHQVLYPAEVDTQDRPNPLADALPGYGLTIDLGTSKWRLAVVRTEHLGGNRWRAWCERPVELGD